MSNAWTVGKVGPTDRAIMRDGAVHAVAGSEAQAKHLVHLLNAGKAGAAAAMRDAIEELLQAMERYYVKEADIRASLSEMLRIGQEGRVCRLDEGAEEVTIDVRCPDHPMWEPMHCVNGRLECHSGWSGSANGRSGLAPCSRTFVEGQDS